MNFKHLKLIIKLRLYDWLLPPYRGTIIIGSVRSGTTLALRILCPDLTADEERDGSLFNEYHPFSNQVIRVNVEKSLLMLPIVMQNRHHIFKLPHIAYLLPVIKPKYNVIVTFGICDWLCLQC